MTTQVHIPNEQLWYAGVFGPLYYVGESHVFLFPGGISPDNQFWSIIDDMGLGRPNPQIIPLWRNDTDMIKVLGGIEITTKQPPISPFGTIWSPTDRYRVGQDAVLFAVIVTDPGKEITYTISINGEVEATRPLVPNASGMAQIIAPELKNLQMGQYKVEITGTQISYEFVVEQFRLPRLSVQMVGTPQRTGDTITWTLYLTSNGETLANTPVKIQLLIDDQRHGDAQTLTTDSTGQVTSIAPLPKTEGPVNVMVSVVGSEDKMSVIPLMGASVTDSQETQVCALGQTWYASLLSTPGSTPWRGLHMRSGEFSMQPFIQMSIIGDKAAIRATEEAYQVTCTCIDVVSGYCTPVYIGHVFKGETFEIPTASPCEIVTIGAFLKVDDTWQAWEGWIPAYAPEKDLGLNVEVISGPVHPGDSAKIKIQISTTSGKPQYVAVTITDQRLTSQVTPTYGLARWMKDALAQVMADLTIGQVTQTISSYAFPVQNTGLGWGEPLLFRGTLEAGFPNSLVPKDINELVLDVLPINLVVAPSLTLVSPRREVLQTLFADIVLVEGADVTIDIPVGSSLAEYIIKAFCFDPENMQWQEATGPLRVTKDVSAAVVAPLYADAQDTVPVRIHLEAGSGLASYVVTHENEVITYGANIQTPADIEVYTRVGDTSVTIRDDQTGGTDSVVTTIEPIGYFLRRTKSLHVVLPGESISRKDLDATSIAVMPGLAVPLRDLMASLRDYHGACCQQTSGKVLEALVRWLQTKDPQAAAHVIKGIEQMEQMYIPGQGFRMYVQPQNKIWPHYSIDAGVNLQLAGLFLSVDMPDDLKSAIGKGMTMSADVLHAHNESFIPQVPKTMRDAFILSRFGKSEAAVPFVKKHLVPQGGYLVIEGTDSVYKTEQTAYAATVLARGGDLTQAVKAANWVNAQMNDKGSVHSPVDMIPTMFMMQALRQAGIVVDQTTEGLVLINGVEYTLTNAFAYMGEVEQIKALDTPVVVRVIRNKAEDWHNIQSQIPFTIGVKDQHGTFVTSAVKGQDLTLVVTFPQGYQPGYLCHICLPPCLATPGLAQMISVDPEGKSIVEVPIIAIDTTAGERGNITPQSYSILVTDMFSDKKGSVTLPFRVTSRY